jgi:hypothetical protein
MQMMVPCRLQVWRSGTRETCRLCSVPDLRTLYLAAVAADDMLDDQGLNGAAEDEVVG